MPKTLPAPLSAAMDSGSYDPYLKVRLILDDPAVYTSVDVLSFKIQDITAECLIPFDMSYLSKTAFAIERGVIVGGVPSTIRTVYYSITSMDAGPLGIHLVGHVLPPYFLNFDGCIWYTNVIDKVVGADGGWMWDTTLAYEDDTAPWLSYLFYPLTRNLTLPNMQSFFSVIEQKYMIYFADNCNGLFVFQATTARAKDYDAVDQLLSKELETISRRLLYRDEENVVHYVGSAQDPIHNLGYIDTLQGLPPNNVASPKPFKSSKLPVHLKYRTGDVVQLGTASHHFDGRIKVTEVFDPKANPSWHMILEPVCWFRNSEGGTMPTSVEQAGAYIPIQTGAFNGVLSSADTNLQAALDTIDDHTHPAADIPVQTGAFAGILSVEDTDLQAALDTIDDHTHPGSESNVPDPSAALDMIIAQSTDGVLSWSTRTNAQLLDILGISSKAAASQEDWHEVGAAGEPAFSNSWVNFGSNYTTCGFMKDTLGFVHLKGLVKNGTINQVIYVLPSGYRPATRDIYGVDSNGAHARLDVAEDGAVKPMAGSNAWVSLSGIIFKAA